MVEVQDVTWKRGFIDALYDLALWHDEIGDEQMATVYLEIAMQIETELVSG